jgi:polyphosphate glucokinase
MEILGIDVGGTGMKAAPVNVLSGEMVGERFRIPTPEGAKPDDMAVVAKDLAKHFNWTGPIGMGFPSAVRSGVVCTAANIDQNWIGTDAARLFGNATGCPVYVANDADVAGLAEMNFGAGRGRDKGVVMVITLGTGLGTAIFTDGYLVPNTELGHIEIRGKDAERRASDAARQRKNMSWEEWGGKLSEYFGRLENLFWPELFIVGGGVSKSWDKFGQYIKIRTPLVPAQLLNQAGIVGAAMYAYRSLPAS